MPLRSPHLRRAWLAAVVVGEIGFIAAQGHIRSGWAWVPVLVVAAASLGLAVAEHRHPTLSSGTVVVAAALVALGAVAVAPFGSRDLYQYAMYGRMVVHDHANPYLIAPSRFPHEGLFRHLAPAWRSTRTVYGPVFTAWSALGAIAYGRSPLLARLFFQGSGAAALVGAVGYLRWRGASTAALVATGLSPVLVATVNGGHNDLLAGVAAMIGIDLVRRRESVAGGAALAVACGIKLSVLPAVGAVGLILLVRQAWRPLGRFLAGFAPPLIGAYLVVGGARALGPLAAVAHARSRASVWSAVQALGARLDVLTIPRPELPTLSMATTVVLVALLAVVVVVGRRRAVDPAVLATTLLVVAVFGAVYVLPWYAAAILPVAALCIDSVAARVAHLGGLFLLVAYVVPPGRVDLAVPHYVLASRACGLALGVLVAVAVIGAGLARPAADAT